MSSKAQINNTDFNIILNTVKEKKKRKKKREKITSSLYIRYKIPQIKAILCVFVISKRAFWPSDTHVCRSQNLKT